MPKRRKLKSSLSYEEFEGIRQERQHEDTTAYEGEGGYEVEQEFQEPTEGFGGSVSAARSQPYLYHGQRETYSPGDLPSPIKRSSYDLRSEKERLDASSSLRQYMIPEGDPRSTFAREHQVETLSPYGTTYYPREAGVSSRSSDIRPEVYGYPESRSTEIARKDTTSTVQHRVEQRLPPAFARGSFKPKKLKQASVSRSKKAKSRRKESMGSAPSLQTVGTKRKRRSQVLSSAMKAKESQFITTTKMMSLKRKQSSSNQSISDSIREDRISKRRPWTAEEDALLTAAVKKHNGTNWKAIAEMVPNRTHVQCLQRWRKSLHPDVKKGRWTTEEDEALLKIVAEKQNIKNWGHVARFIEGRTAKQCRERYTNHLDPEIKKGNWTEEEDRLIAEGHTRLGNKWAEIASHLPGRTENSVKIRAKCIKRRELKRLRKEEKLKQRQRTAVQKSSKKSK